MSRLDVAVSAELADGVTRARVVAELLLLAAVMYDGESMVAGITGRQAEFERAAGSAYDSAQASMRAAVVHE